MILNLIKEQDGNEYSKEMEKEYGSIEDLEEIFNKTNNMVLYADLENWKYLIKNPDEKIGTVQNFTEMIFQKRFNFHGEYSFKI